MRDDERLAREEMLECRRVYWEAGALAAHLIEIGGQR